MNLEYLMLRKKEKLQRLVLYDFIYMKCPEYISL